MGNIKVNDKMLDMIASNEGYIPFVYDDAVTVGRDHPEYKAKYFGRIPYKEGNPKGTLTVGYGQTRHSVSPKEWEMFVKDGKSTNKILSKQEAKEGLRQILPKYIDQVNKTLDVDVGEDQGNTLVDLMYRNGAGNFKNSKIADDINKGDFDAAANKISNDKWFQRSGGKFTDESHPHYRGISRRNKANFERFSKDKYRPKPEQPREPAGSFNPSDVDFSLMPSDTPKDPKKVSDGEFNLAVEDAGFDDEIKQDMAMEDLKVQQAMKDDEEALAEDDAMADEEPVKEELVEEEVPVKIPETFEPRDLVSSVNMSKMPEDTTPEFAREKPIQSEFMPSVEVETREFPEMNEDPIELGEVKLEEPRTVGEETNKNLRPSMDKIKAAKITDGKLDKDLPGIDYIVNAQLVPDELWKTKDLEEIAKEINSGIRNKRSAIEHQFRKDKDSAKKDKWIMAIALGLQAFANGMAARAQRTPDQIVDGRLIRGRRAGPVKQVDMSILKELEDDIKDTRAYRMKRAGLTLADAKFRFKLMKDERDLGLRQEKDQTKVQEKVRLEGKRDKEKLDKEFKKDVESSNKQVTKSHEAAIKDVMKANPKKFEEAVKTSLAGNLGMSDEQIEELTQKPNFFSEFTGWDLGTTPKEKEELLRDIRSKMESELEEKPKTNKISDSIYNPAIHYLGKAANGKTYIYRKDNDQGVAEYGKQ